MNATLRERLNARLVPCADPTCDCSGCLLWTGHLDRDGYGQMTVDRKTNRVHRVAWVLENSPIPDGLQLDHVKARGCRHRNCAKVAHLEPVTNLENTLRGDNFMVAQIRGTRSPVTHCPQNHPYDEANTYTYPNGSRHCRACNRAHHRAWRLRRLQATQRT